MNSTPLRPASRHAAPATPPVAPIDRTPLSRRAAWAGAALITTVALAACGTSTAGPAAQASATSGAAATVAGATEVAPADGVRLDSGWVKAGSGMTAVFGTVVNGTDEAVTIVGGSSPAAGKVEVHTMAKQPDGSMKMMEKEGGLVVPAGGSAELAPGADHIMLLELKAPLVNGDDASVVMVTADGTELAWTVPVRSFAGAEETYVPEDH
ncbi:copper chaperone PCu(A)C [Intrasporangium sp.]|uniref:copper chaperone PCu(A)C n=1 Tax=Intrasporangium sp. TaxID=1925024 RepID=UPI00293B12F6|nr:copper chaperone PCu(A)C [Intrasporangium sp.]MDV3221245.1 copper chaperone PCu(A)C [Intrasporangium sp.]